MKYFWGCSDLVSQKIINDKTLISFVDNVDLIKGCVSSPNVVFSHFSNWSLKDLLTCKPRLIIFPISNSIIRFFASLN